MEDIKESITDNDEDDDDEDEEDVDEIEKYDDSQPHLTKPRKTISLSDSEEEEEEEEDKVLSPSQEEKEEKEEKQKVKDIEQERKEIESILEGNYNEEEKEISQKRKLNSNITINENTPKKVKINKMEIIRKIDKVIIAIKSVMKRYNNYYKLQDVINNNTMFITKPKVLAELFNFFKTVYLNIHFQ